MPHAVPGPWRSGTAPPRRRGIARHGVRAGHRPDLPASGDVIQGRLIGREIDADARRGIGGHGELLAPACGADACRRNPPNCRGAASARHIDGAVTRKRNRSRRRLRGDCGQWAGDMGRGWQQFHETIVGGIRHEQIQRVVERESAIRARHRQVALQSAGHRPCRRPVRLRQSSRRRRPAPRPRPMDRRSPHASPLH